MYPPQKKKTTKKTALRLEMVLQGNAGEMKPAYHSTACGFLPSPTVVRTQLRSFFQENVERENNEKVTRMNATPICSLQ